VDRAEGIPCAIVRLGQHQYGVRIQDRVKLDSVLEAKAQGGYLRNCLREVDERYILDQWYKAWAQKYEIQATWIM
jgi:hypothetical protein